MFNQLDSHDTARFKSLLGKDVAACRWLVVWLFAGRACDAFTTAMKVGVDGNNDPFCRKPFPWDPALQDGALLELYNRMSKLRKANQALRYGGCQVIYAEDNVVVFVASINSSACWWRSTAAKPAGGGGGFAAARRQRLAAERGRRALHDGVLTLPISASVWFSR